MNQLKIIILFSLKLLSLYFISKEAFNIDQLRININIVHLTITFFRLLNQFEFFDCMLNKDRKKNSIEKKIELFFWNEWPKTKKKSSFDKSQMKSSKSQLICWPQWKIWLMYLSVNFNTMYFWLVLSLCDSSLFSKFRPQYNYKSTLM